MNGIEKIASYGDYDYDRLNEFVTDYRNAVDRLKNAAAWAVGSEVDELRHHNYDCGRKGCKHNFCKQNPDGWCENCGSMRRVGMHYLKQGDPMLWGYNCERSY